MLTYLKTSMLIIGLIFCVAVANAGPIIPKDEIPLKDNDTIVVENFKKAIQELADNTVYNEETEWCFTVDDECWKKVHEIFDGGVAVVAVKYGFKDTVTWMGLFTDKKSGLRYIFMEVYLVHPTKKEYFKASFVVWETGDRRNYKKYEEFRKKEAPEQKPEEQKPEQKPESIDV